MGFLKRKTAAIGLALASALTLGGCYDDGYGYGGVSAGYGYDDGYYGDGYAGAPGYYGGGYGYPGYGWYNGFYYPGSGIYIYDRGGSRRRWNDDHRRYWEGRRAQAGNWRGRGNDGRPGVGRPGDGRPDGQWSGRGDRPGEGRWAGRPDRPGQGRWRDGATAPGVTQPGTPGGAQADAQSGAGLRAGRTDRAPGNWQGRGWRGADGSGAGNGRAFGNGATAQRPQAVTPRAEPSPRGFRGGGMRNRGETRPQ